jgi:AAHS family 4-hydroxybenzoate transporter-like MFS transporter
MALGQSVDVAALIDSRRLTALNWQVVVICFFVIFFDGYDISAVAFAGPSLIREWGLTNMALVGSIFSATFVAMIFGGPLFGWIGDRWGRKTAIISASLVIGVFSLATMLATTIPMLLALRFLTGIGIGGLTSNTMAINAEFAPRRVRATMIIIMFTGITLGGALPGPVANLLLPHYGWQVLFLIGGITPLVMAGVCAVYLPESIKFLVARPDRREAAVQLLRRLAPATVIAPDARLYMADERPAQGFHPRLLFADGLKAITPLLWVLFFCNQMSFYFVNLWLPTVLTSAHLPESHAAWAMTLFQVGGTLGGLALMRPVDKFGIVPICVLFCITIPIACSIGYASESEPLLMVVVALAGFCLLGLQFGINAVSVMLYPTPVRSAGSAVATTFGRFGSTAGPVAAGYLIGTHMSLQHLYLFLAAPVSLAAVCCIVMARIHYRQFHGTALERSTPIEDAHPAE